MNTSLIFNIQCCWKLTEWFSCTRIFHRLILVRCHRNVVITFFRCWDHFWFNIILVLLLIIIFIYIFVLFLCFPDIFVHTIHSYLIIGQTQWRPYFFSCSDCNNPLIITHCCSNKSISNIDFRTLINALDLAHCAARKVLPSVWKK